MCIGGLHFKNYRYGIYVFAGLLVTMILVVLLVQYEHDRVSFFQNIFTELVKNYILATIYWLKVTFCDARKG